jgi:hypothetical protein
VSWHRGSAWSASDGKDSVDAEHFGSDTAPLQIVSQRPPPVMARWVAIAEARPSWGVSVAEQFEPRRPMCRVLLPRRKMRAHSSKEYHQSHTCLGHSVPRGVDSPWQHQTTPREWPLAERMTTMTRDDLHALLTKTKVAYQPADDTQSPTEGDVVTVTREAETLFVVWRLAGEAWSRCGTIAIDDDARAWNAAQMDRFWGSRWGTPLQLGCLPLVPPPLTGSPVTRSELAGPVESIMRMVHLVWMELQSDRLGYRPLWCDDVNVWAPQASDRTRTTGKPKRRQPKERDCTVVEVRGSGRALRWA